MPAGVHAMTLSAHKAGGPKGAAALVLDKRVELQPLIAGGGHERGLRSGTENVPAIVGFGVAAELAAQRVAELSAALTAMQVKAGKWAVRWVPEFLQRGQRLPNTSYFRFSGYRWRNAGRQTGPGRLCSGQWGGMFQCQSGTFACLESDGSGAGNCPWCGTGEPRGGQYETEIDQFINALQATVGRCKG
jgi:cysteine desulfurase